MGFVLGQFCLLVQRWVRENALFGLEDALSEVVHPGFVHICQCCMVAVVVESNGALAWNYFEAGKLGKIRQRDDLGLQLLENLVLKQWLLVFLLFLDELVQVRFYLGQVVAVELGIVSRHLCVIVLSSLLLIALHAFE